MEDKEVKQNVKLIDNLEINKEKNFVIVSVNPKMHSLDVIYASAHSFINDAYVVIDGNPDEFVLVKLSPFKDDCDLENLGREFNNALIDYSASKIKSEFERKIQELKGNKNE